MVCFVEKYKYLIVIFILFAVCAGCRPGAVKNEAALQDSVPFIYIERLIGHALDMAKTNAAESAVLPPYLEAMLADGKITIGLGIGTDDLGRIRVPQDRQHWLWQDTFELFGQIVLIEGRLLLTRENFRSALSECEIIYLTSHSRFGAGPVFLKDGKAKPFLMQQTAGYEIVMPGPEVSGYDGTVIRRYPGPLKKQEYVVFAPDSTDLDSITPLAGYQLLVLSTCTSRRHFFDEIQTLRKGLPTTAVFTTRTCCMDPLMRPFLRMLYEIFAGSSITGVVAGMNESYRDVSWEYVTKGVHPWQVLNTLYAVGIHRVM